MYSLLQCDCVITYLNELLDELNELLFQPVFTIYWLKIVKFTSFVSIKGYQTEGLPDGGATRRTGYQTDGLPDGQATRPLTTATKIINQKFPLHLVIYMY